MGMTEKGMELGLNALSEEFGEKRVAMAIDAVKKFRVEVPSWLFGPFGGGRFGGYMPPGAARDIFEKMDDIAFVNKLTGASPRFATHVLWDFSKDGITGDFKIAEKVMREAQRRGLGLGAVNPTYFLKGSFRGSFSADEEKTRKNYIEQTMLAGKIAEDLGNNLVTLWFPDGSNYPGQRDLGRAYSNTKESLRSIRESISNKVKILIEYKVFEPGTYSTTIPDWGASFILSKQAGKNMGVLVDLGHHHHGTNIEQIVAMLIKEKIPAGFHFNTRYSADDDHSVEPNQEMARIFYELVNGAVVANPDPSKDWAYMIDQCSGRENRMHAVLHSIDSLQISLAKGMLVDAAALRKHQDADEVILANRMINDAMINADVRPIVAKARAEKMLPIDPIAAYVKSGYQDTIEKSRR